MLLIFPLLTAAAFGLAADRRLGAHIYDPANGGITLFQHLFWYFGHPEVYVIALPFFGIVTEVFPVFSRKPIFGYSTLVYASVAIAALSVAVWAHHMYVTGAVLLPFFSFMTFLIAVPTGIKFFNWLGTMWRGQLTFETPMLFSIGFLVTFLAGGLSGVLLASPPLDFHVSDTYFVVAHFHYVLFGVIVFATYAGIYFWFPKMTGRMLDERLGKLHFWLTLIGFNTTFLVQHWLGNAGMPRRYADYLPRDGFTTLNIISTLGAFILGVSMIPFAWNVFKSWRYGEVVTVDDPWGYGNSLEWATSCPPPRHNFTELPTGSAPSGRRSSCTTRTWWTGCGPRPTSVANTTTRSRRRRSEKPDLAQLSLGQVGDLVTKFLPCAPDRGEIRSGAQYFAGHRGKQLTGPGAAETTERLRPPTLGADTGYQNRAVQLADVGHLLQRGADDHPDRTGLRKARPVDRTGVIDDRLRDGAAAGERPLNAGTLRIGRRGENEDAATVGGGQIQQRL